MNEDTGEQYLKTLAENGVDLPELKEEEKKEETPKLEVPPKEEPKKLEKEPEADPTKINKEEPKEPRKRSIYDDLKDERKERKEAEAQLETLSREKAELERKLEAFGKAETPEEKQEAKDDLEAFAKEIDASPEALRKMRDIFLKDYKPGIDPTLLKDLEDFRTYRAANSKAIEKTLFEEEFTKVTPELKKLFPAANAEEMQILKGKLDEISHTKDWHDKPLDYIAFKHLDEFSTLISPKKRGLESKGSKEAEIESQDIDFNAYPVNGTQKQKDEWEAAYTKAASQQVSVGGKPIL